MNLVRKIREFFGIKPLRAPDKFTMHHPDLEGQTELAFIAGGIHFYRFKEEYKHPVGRYKYVYKFLREHELAMSRETLSEYIKQLKTQLNGGSKGQNINIGEAWRILHNMDTRVALPFDPDNIKRLASAVYFTDTEDLSTYDSKEGAEKIKIWDDNKCHDFFLTRPIGELLHLNSGSIIYLEEYLSQAQVILKELTLDQQTQSSVNS